MYEPSNANDHPALSPEKTDDLLGLAHLLDLSPGPGGSRGSDYQKTYDLFAEAVSHLFPTPSQICIFALYPSSQIVAHADPPIVGVRYHIPLQTNLGCWCFHGGDWRRLTVGGIYQMAPDVIHGAVNWGTTLRLHLTIDHP